MRLVFWQNCMSPHQLPYITELLGDGRVDDVTVVAGEAVRQARRSMGWDLPSFAGLEHCKVFIAPDDSEVDKLLSERKDDSIHLFSGIRGYAFVFSALKRSLKHEVARGLIVELPTTYALGRSNGKPLWLHRLRFMLMDMKYARHVKYVFAIGREAVGYYGSLLRGWKVFPFGYCTKMPELPDAFEDAPKGDASFAFAGSLSRLKSVNTLIAACGQLAGYRLCIVGNGNQLSALRRQAKGFSQVEFAGTKMNSEMPAWLMEQDVLVLPSLYDGWGAVVNEALGCGCYVICSDMCGAKALLGDKRCGATFAAGNSKELAGLLRHCIENIDEIRQNRLFRHEWVKTRAGGKVMAKYMIDCLYGQNPPAPWLK